MGAAVSAGQGAVQSEQHVLDTVRTKIQGVAATAAGVLTALLLTAGFVLATGADTIPQALASLACFALGAWPLGVFDLKKKGGKA